MLSYNTSDFSNLSKVLLSTSRIFEKKIEIYHHVIKTDNLFQDLEQFSKVIICCVQQTCSKIWYQNFSSNPKIDSYLLMTPYSTTTSVFFHLIENYVTETVD